MNDSGDITAKFAATERAIDELQQPTIEIERTRNAIRETQKRNDAIRAFMPMYISNAVDISIRYPLPVGRF